MLRRHRLADQPQLPPQPVDLVDERDHHRRRLGVEIKVLHQVLEQPHPRHVDLGECEPPLALGRRQALGGDEGSQPRHRQPATRATTSVSE